MKRFTWPKEGAESNSQNDKGFWQETCEYCTFEVVYLVSMTIHTGLKSVYCRAASLQRKNPPWGKDAFQQRKGFSNARVQVQWWTAEQGVQKMESLNRETSLGASPRTNDKQREISDMDGKTTRQWEEHKKTEIQGIMNCLRNNNRKIGVMKKMLDEAGLYGSIPPGKEERHPTPTRTCTRTNSSYGFLFERQRKKSIYIQAWVIFF